MDYVVGKVQGAVDKVVEWGKEWGCRFSVEKTQSVFFTNKRIDERLKIRMYGKEIERVGTFKLLGVLFDSHSQHGQII